MKKFLTLFISFLISTTNILALEQEPQILPAQRAVVQSVEYVETESDAIQAKQEVVLKLIGGENNLELVTLENILTGNPQYDIKLKKGTKVLLHVEETDGSKTFSIADIERSPFTKDLFLL